MNTTFGALKPKNNTITELLKDFKQFDIDFGLDTNSSNKHVAQMKSDLLDRASSWFDKNPPSFKNLSTWSKLLTLHLQSTQDTTDVNHAQPLANYLNFIATLDFNRFQTDNDERSSRFASIINVFRALQPLNLDDPHALLTHIADKNLVNLNQLMEHLDVHSEFFFHYNHYVQDDAGEFRDLPNGMFMRTLLGLAFSKEWSITGYQSMYHQMWDVLAEHDLELTPVSSYVEAGDPVAFLIRQLPGSTQEALEFYMLHGDALCHEQQQHILSMSLSHLAFPEGLHTLIEAVYHNHLNDDGRSIKMLEAINPAAKVIGTLIELYGSPEEMMKNIGTLPYIKEVFMTSDTMRNKANVDSLVATDWG